MQCKKSLQRRPGLHTSETASAKHTPTGNRLGANCGGRWGHAKRATSRTWTHSRFWSPPGFAMGTVSIAAESESAICILRSPVVPSVEQFLLWPRLNWRRWCSRSPLTFVRWGREPTIRTRTENVVLIRSPVRPSRPLHQICCCLYAFNAYLVAQSWLLFTWICFVRLVWGSEERSTLTWEMEIFVFPFSFLRAFANSAPPKMVLILAEKQHFNLNSAKTFRFLRERRISTMFAYH